MNEQTKGLRANRDKASNSQKELESEIAKLEATLAQKRRSLAEVKIEVGTVTEKIRLVEEEFTGTLTEVEKLINEEQLRKAAHQVTVDGLTTQESQMLRDEADFRDEKASMTFQLRTYDARIKCYGTLAAYLEGDKAKILQDYYAKSVGVALDGRKKGRHILAPSVNSSEASPDTTAAAPNPATALRQKESQLRSTELRAASLESELSELQLQIQDIDKKVPILENAKKAAAAAKQFKEAAAKTAEVKQLQEDKAAKSEAVSKVQDEQKEVASAIEKLKTEVDSERRRAEEAVGIFTQSYAKILGEAISSAEGRAPLLSFLTNVVELDESAAAGTLEGGDALNGSKSSNSSFGNSQTANNNDDERSSADAEVAVSLLLDDAAHHTTANEPIAATAIALLGNLKAELLSASPSVDNFLNDAIEAAAKQIGKEMAVIAETRAQLFKDFKEKKANGSASASPDTEESAKETTLEAHPASNSESLKQPAAEPEEVSQPPQPVTEIPEPTFEAAGEAGLSPVGSTTSSKRSKRAKADAFALMPDEQPTEQQPVEENGNAGWGSATSGNFGNSGWGSENAEQTTTAGGGWGSSEATGGWGATTEAETTETFFAPEPIVDNRATIEAQISEIEAQLNAAMEAEDYEQCDALQTQIDELKSKLA